MKLEIDIKEKDIEALKNKVMTIEDMDNTLEGRVTCAIVRAALNTQCEKAESEDKEMKKQLGELKIDKSADYYGKVIKALEDAGFIIILSDETTTDKYYIVAESVKEK
jgi:hypothetical protein